VDAPFMPNPLAHAFGSGCTTHTRSFEGDVKNSFHDPATAPVLLEGRQALPSPRPCVMPPRDHPRD